MTFEIVQLDKIDTIMDEIDLDISNSAFRAGKKAGMEVIPDAFRANFLLSGQRDGRDRWPDVTRMDLRTENLDRPDQPLIDTGSLANSMMIVDESEPDDSLLFWDFRPANNMEVGFEHDEGIALTPEGNPIPRRQHMFLAADEDLQLIDEMFEAEFEK